jgi:hypothetical protein
MIAPAWRKNTHILDSGRQKAAIILRPSKVPHCHKYRRQPTTPPRSQEPREIYFSSDCPRSLDCNRSMLANLFFIIARKHAEIEIVHSNA